MIVLWPTAVSHALHAEGKLLTWATNIYKQRGSSNGFSDLICCSLIQKSNSDK